MTRILVSCAGLEPLARLAARTGLHDLAAARVRVGAKGGANADLKVPALVLGMVAGADSIDDMDLLRHGGMDRLFTGVRAPSTLGTFLRALTFGHVRQLDSLARGAANLLTQALNTAKEAGVKALMVVRMDSAYYNADMVAAARKAGARFSITAGMNPAVRTAITGIDQDAWTTIKYPNAIWDEDEQRWVSDAQIAEVPFTAFTGRLKRLQVTARLIVHRVKRLNPKAAAGQDKLFTHLPATTRCSPTPRCAWSKPKPATAGTQSSSR